MTDTRQAVRPKDRAKPGARLSPRSRKIVLVAHVLSSVGWFGGACAMIVLGICSAEAEPAVRHASFELVHMCDRFVLIPLSLLSLLTGLIVSLGTKWGLARHYWVLVKLAGTLVVMVFATFFLSQWVQEVIALTAADPGADISGLTVPIKVGAIAMALLLLGITVVSIVKPWGRTARGRRDLARRAGSARRGE